MELTLNVRCNTVIFERTYSISCKVPRPLTCTEHNEIKHDTTGMQNTTAGKQIYFGVRGGSSSDIGGLPASRGDGDRTCCNLKFHLCKVSAMSRHVPLNASLVTMSSTSPAIVHKLRSRAPLRQ